MMDFIQQLINGLSQGSIYALIALGYTMVYGVLRFINFAHGDVFMVGAFAGMYLHRWIHPRPGVGGALLVLIGSMIICAALGILIEKLAYRPLRQRPRLIVLITAIGVSLFLEYSAQLIFGPNRQPFPDLVETKLITGVGKLAIRNTQLVVLGVTIALLVGLWFVVMKTRLGLAMRALSFNATAAALMGVNTDVVISFTFGLGSALAAAGGIFSCMLYPQVQPFMGVAVGLKAFVAAVLGGIGHIPGAALGGLIIGVVETMVVAYSGQMGTILFKGGVVLAGAGYLWLVVKAFQKNARWGFLTVAVPVVIVFKDWLRARSPSLLALAGIVTLAVGLLVGERGISSGYRDAVAFVILILILLFKPAGLLGRTEREKV